MRVFLALCLAVVLVGAVASCGGGGSPSPVRGAPGVTTPATPLASPAGSPGYGY